MTIGHVVVTGAAAERHQLGLGVIGELAAEPRILAGNAGARRAMAAGTGGNALFGDAAAIDVASEFGDVLVPGTDGFSGFDGVVGRQVGHVLCRQRRRDRRHDGVRPIRRLAAFLGLELRKLLAKIGRMLGRDLRDWSVPCCCRRGRGRRHIPGWPTARPWPDRLGRNRRQRGVLRNGTATLGADACRRCGEGPRRSRRRYAPRPLAIARDSVPGVRKLLLPGASHVSASSSSLPAARSAHHLEILHRAVPLSFPSFATRTLTSKPSSIR